MPKTTVFRRMASTYFFWPTVLGLMERPRLVRTESPKTTEGRAVPSPRMMSIEWPTVSAVRASPRSSRVMSSSKRRATRSESACSPVMVISLPRTKTVLSKAASISLSSSSRVPRRLTIEWFPGTSTLTWTCVGCRTLAVCPSVRGRGYGPTGGGRRIPEYSEPWVGWSGRRAGCQGGGIGSGPVEARRIGVRGAARLGAAAGRPAGVLLGRPSVAAPGGADRREVLLGAGRGLLEPGPGRRRPLAAGPRARAGARAGDDHRLAAGPHRRDLPGQPGQRLL